MGFKVSDSELADNTKLITDSANSLLEIAREAAMLLEQVRGALESDTIDPAIESTRDSLAAALMRLQYVPTAVVMYTNQFIEQLDTDDAKFD